jgi:hypothetical protein
LKTLQYRSRHHGYILYKIQRSKLTKILQPEINRALDNQEYIEVEDHHQQAGPAEFPDIKPVVPGTADDTGAPDLHAVEPEEPDFTERFQYFSFSHGPLMCRQTHCMGHPPKTPQTCTPTLLSVSEVKEEVKTETG